MAINEDNHLVASKRRIKTGKSYNGETEVISGIEPGDVLINEGSRDVVEGGLLEIHIEKTTENDG